MVLFLGSTLGARWQLNHEAQFGLEELNDSLGRTATGARTGPDVTAIVADETSEPTWLGCGGMRAASHRATRGRSNSCRLWMKLSKR